MRHRWGIARWAAALSIGVLGCARQDAGEALAVVDLAATVEPATATTGDLVTYKLRVDYDADLEVVLPEAEETFGGLEVVSSGRKGPRRAALLSGRRRVQELTYTLRADLVGSFELPSVEVGYRSQTGDDAESPWTTISSEPLQFEVQSVLPDDGSASDIRDIKPLEPNRMRLGWLWWLAGLVLAGLIAAAIFRRRRRSSADPAAPPLPPHVVAYRALDELRARQLEDAAAVRRFYFELSETLRTYVEARFGLNATDLTSEEILAALGSSRPSGRAAWRSGGVVVDRARLVLEPEADALLRRFLGETDRVKYADDQPRREEIDASWDHARRFVEATEPVAEAEESAGPPDQGEQAA